MLTARKVLPLQRKVTKSVRRHFTTMINRTLVRTKVILTLYAYFQDADKTRHTAEKELTESFSDTYNLYFLLLDLVNEITLYAQTKLEEAQEKAVAMHIEYKPNYRFVNNVFAQQVFDNQQLRSHLENNKLDWNAATNCIDHLYQQITASDVYKEYMEADETSYEADKQIWRKIFQTIVPNNEYIESGLEELEIALDGNMWVTDMNVITSYVVKTIKRFEQEAGAGQELLKMFTNESELDFAKQLLRQSIERNSEYQTLIESKLKNWDPERIAYMDMIIMKTAVAELFTFPEIAAQVTINEYLELAREYSTENSPHFINGILDEIIKEQTQKGKLLKGLALKRK